MVLGTTANNSIAAESSIKTAEGDLIVIQSEEAGIDAHVGIVVTTSQSAKHMEKSALDGTVDVHVVEDSDSSAEEYFLGAIDTPAVELPWCVTLNLGRKPIDFKIDTGADVSVLSKNVY